MFMRLLRSTAMQQSRVQEQSDKKQLEKSIEKVRLGSKKP